MTLRRTTTSSIALALAATLAACGGDDDAADDTAPPAVSEAPAGAGDAPIMNDADVEFAQGMIVHHEQAIEMAEIALDPRAGASAEVLDLATRVQRAQDPEVELMTGWLTAAGEPLTMDTSDGHDMTAMDGMMTVEQMSALASMTGDDFDRMWLEMMIAHHEGAIAQSRTVTSNGSNPDVLALADQIITDQEAEIAEIQALLAG